MIVLPELSIYHTHVLLSLRAFQNYNKIKAPYQYQDIVKKLSRNKDIYLLKQDKGRGIVILDRPKYLEKCLEILDSKDS